MKKYIISSEDNKKKISVNLTNTFIEKGFSKEEKNKKLYLSLGGEKRIGVICIGKDSELIKEIDNSNNLKIKYNNKTCMISMNSVIGAALNDELNIAVVIPIDSEYYYIGMFEFDNYYLKMEDLESLLNFEVTKK